MPKKREGAGKPVGRPNLVCGPAQTCWHRFARYFDVELREIRCEGSRLMMSPEEVVNRCDENTIGIVPTLGVTFTLQYEPVQAVALALDDLQEECGARHSDPRRRGQWRLCRSVHPSGSGLGFSNSARQVDKCLGTEVRPGAP